MGTYSKQKCKEIIDECLNKKKDNEWTVEKFMKKLHVSNRSVKGYIKELKESDKAPIKYRKNSGYFYSNPFQLKKPILNEEDTSKLYAAIEILKELNFPPQIFDIDKIILQLENASVIEKQSTTEIVQFEHHPLIKGWKTYFDKLYTAIKHKQVLSIKYKRFHLIETKTHNFHSYLLKEYQNRWYVLGKIEGNEYITTLAIDRIEDINRSEIPYKIDLKFNGERYFRNAIGITFEGDITPREIKFRVVKNQVPYFENNPLHLSQKILTQYDNGDAEFAILVIINIELKLLLMQYAHTLTLIQPVSLKRNLNEMIQKAVKLNIDK